MYLKRQFVLRVSKKNTRALLLTRTSTHHITSHTHIIHSTTKMSSSSQNDGIANVLIALGPLSQDDVNCSIIEYFSRHLASPKVNAFVFSFCPQSPHTANEKEELSLDAETKRKGCRKAGTKTYSGRCSTSARCLCFARNTARARCACIILQRRNTRRKVTNNFRETFSSIFHQLKRDIRIPHKVIYSCCSHFEEHPFFLHAPENTH